MGGRDDLTRVLAVAGALFVWLTVPSPVALGALEFIGLASPFRGGKPPPSRR
jgi:hypothetical protein